MKYQIQKHSGLSAYLQLYRQLREDIVSGLLPLGAKLPSKRSFAEGLGVSVITVEHALELLCDEAPAAAFSSASAGPGAPPPSPGRVWRR